MFAHNLIYTYVYMQHIYIYIYAYAGPLKGDLCVETCVYTYDSRFSCVQSIREAQADPGLSYSFRIVAV